MASLKELVHTVAAMAQQSVNHSIGDTVLYSLKLCFPLALCVVLLPLAFGCGDSTNTAKSGKPPTPTPTPTPLFQGKVLSGVGVAIAGSTLTLYAAGSSGYQAHATVLASASSDSSGNFGFVFDPLSGCPSGNASDQTYVVAAGGDVGFGTNSGIGLMALTGPCNGLTASTFLVINELTTAAAQWALAQFIDSTGAMMGTSATNLTGLKNSATEAENDLVVSYLPSGGSPTNVGVVAGFLPSPSSCTGPPSPNCVALARLDLLANIIAACVESSGPSSTPCTTLFGSTSHSANTLAAAHSVVTNPATNIAPIFGVQMTPSTSAPFQPTMSSAPSDFTLTLNFAPSAASIFAPAAIALDSFGDVFLANQRGNSVSELVASSGYTTGLNLAPSGAGLDHPNSIALDDSGNVFVTNGASNSVSELTESNGYATGLNFAPGGAGFANPSVLALDGSGNAFAINTNNSVSELVSSSGYTTGLNLAPPDASFNSPTGIAVDGNANLFVSNSGTDDQTGSVSELFAKSGYGNDAISFTPADAQLAMPSGVALDRSGDVFAVNGDSSSVSELTASSRYFDGLNFALPNSGLGSIAIALDGSDNVFVANNGPVSVSELIANIGYATRLNFVIPDPFFGDACAIALDSSGNVFLSNINSSSVSEIIGVGTPVLTPIQACLAKGQSLCVP